VERDTIAIVDHPTPLVTLCELLKVRQLGEETGNGISRGADKSLKGAVLVMARLFCDPISPPVAADFLNPVLQLHRCQMGGAGLSVGVDQIKHGINADGYGHDFGRS
jgi:hypothetical protein